MAACWICLGEMELSKSMEFEGMLKQNFPPIPHISANISVVKSDLFFFPQK